MLTFENIRIEYLKDFAVTDNEKPRFTLIAKSDTENTYAVGYCITVKSDEKVFWFTGRRSGDTTANIFYMGEKLEPCTVYTVEAIVFDNLGNEASRTAHFETGKMDEKWQGRWITHPTYKLGMKGSPVPFVFKKAISPKGKIKSARIYSTAMGVYTLQLNGQRVSDDYLAPGYTSYKNNLQYQVYDITDKLQESSTLLCTVAGGWACGEFGLLKQNKAFADKPALLCEVAIEYEDGSKEIIASDESWLVTTDGPVREASIYDGEVYDARKTLDKAAFTKAAIAKMRVKPKMRANYGVLPHPVETLTPVSAAHGKNGTIYDFGQNFAGVVNIKLNAHAGQIITVRHAEVLIDGELFTRPLRSAKARFEYICRKGEQEYNPEYTYMGFRYIEIKGVRPEDITVSAKVLTSADEELCTFTCSDEDINRLQQNIRYGGRSNFMDIPTDCPQRDERLGWTGDIAVFASTAFFNFNMSRFLEKWLVDVAAEQTDGGAIPVVVPHVRFLQKMITAGWSDCCVLVPWASYLATGDTSVLSRFYPMMKKYLDGVEKKSGLLSTGEKKYIWSFGFSYGDWCAPDEKQLQWMRKKKWISTAYFANSCAIASKIADIIGRDEDAAHFTQLRQKIEDAYRDVFTDGNGNIRREFQTAYVCPLYFGMTKDGETKKYAANLARLVEEAGNHLTTGFLGTPYLLFALSDNGYAEKAYDVLFQDTCPSWLYEVKAGGTTVWERWDALRPDGTVNLGEGAIEGSNSAYAGGMVSFNHYANGAVGDWLYRRVAGIEPLIAGYKKIKIAPVPGGRLTWVKCEKETPYGFVCSEWTVENDIFTLNVKIPFNATASIIMPDGEIIETGSGNFSYSCKLQEK